MNSMLPKGVLAAIAAAVLFGSHPHFPDLHHRHGH
jgi:hypothetical protein